MLTRAWPLEPGRAVAAVITQVPGGDGRVAAKRPLASARTVVMLDGTGAECAVPFGWVAPGGESVAATTTATPGAAVPVTVTVGVVTCAPPEGEVIASGAFTGGACVT